MGGNSICLSSQVIKANRLVSDGGEAPSSIQHADDVHRAVSLSIGAFLPLLLLQRHSIFYRRTVGWYVRLLRDEVLAEWCMPPDDGPLELHVYCHVSGQERWLAPPQLRNYIFKREMPLVRVFSTSEGHLDCKC